MFDDHVYYQETCSDVESSLIKNEFSRLKDICYLDHTGCPLYGNSHLSSIFSQLSENVFGNPHSGSTTSKYCADSVDLIRYKILHHFNTSPNEYSVIFTSGATAALKLVAESFVWFNKNDLTEANNYEKPVFMYMEDNHTSVLGMRNAIKKRDVEIMCLTQYETISNLMNSSFYSTSNYDTNSLFVYSAQCNFSGVKYPLAWIDKVKKGSLMQATSRKSNWFCLLDAATYLSTNCLDLSVVKPDFVAMSFYKMFGYPTGLGALLVHNSAAHLLEKTYYGGGTVLLAMSRKNFFVPRPVLHTRFEDGTLNFLSIISLEHGLKTYEKVVSLEKISLHCFRLAKYAFNCLSRLHHANGNPVAIIYADTDYSNIETQGNIVNFNLLRPNGEYVGYAEVMNLANLHGIQLRTGCFCNPGACRRHLGLTNDEVIKHYEAGHVCGDDNDLIEGKPTGSVRISFGLYNTLDDVNRFLKVIVDCFVLKPFIQKHPNRLCKSIDYVDIDSYKLLGNSFSPVEGRINAINLIYYWLENFNILDTDSNHGFSSEISPNITVENIEKNDKICRFHLSHLFLYPVKSCGKFSVNKWELSSTGLKYDREWMITTATGVVLTQKSDPLLCLIKPSINLKEKKLILSFEGYPNFILDIESGGKYKTEAWLCSSKVCGDAVKGLDCGDSVSLWLSHVLGKEGLRLIRQQQRNNQSGDLLSFSNQAQYLLINKASIDWLSNRLSETSDCKKESMVDRFRSNFVIDGSEMAFTEQNWKEVKLGGHNFKVSGPCTRCQMICIDQGTGKKTKEPLTTLAASMKGKLRFGIYLSKVHSSTTTLAVGDKVSFKTDPV